MITMGVAYSQSKPFLVRTRGWGVGVGGWGVECCSPALKGYNFLKALSLMCMSSTSRHNTWVQHKTHLWEQMESGHHWRRVSDTGVNGFVATVNVTWRHRSMGTSTSSQLSTVSADRSVQVHGFQVWLVTTSIHPILVQLSAPVSLHLLSSDQAL